MAETFIRTILEASFTAGIAAMVVILLRFPMRKLPRRWSYLLWAVVFFRCLCPFSVESGLSLFNAVPEQSIEFRELLPQSSGTDSEEYSEPEIPTAESASENHSYFPDADDSPYIDHSGNADFSGTNAGIFPAEEFLAAEPGAEKNSTEAFAEGSAEPVNWSRILFPVWAAGTAAMLLYAAISYLRLMGKIRTSIKSENGIYETDMIPTAFSAGLFPPKIYLPCGLSEKERELIIAHEQVHIKRFDFLAKPLAFAGLAIHWFNPLIWAAFILMTRDMELSCDEAVLKALGSEEKKDYSRALLRVSMKRSGLAALPIAFAGTGIKERVKNVLGYKKPRIIATVIAAGIVLTACTVLGTNAVKNSETEGYDEDSLTLIEDDPEENYQMIEIENSAGDRIILLNGKDRSYHENAGLNAALVGSEGQMIIFNGAGSIGINIDPEYITRAVIEDLQIKHYDDYDGDGETDDLTFIAIDMELQMADDYVMPPIGSIADGNKEHGTFICGGNNQRFGIYAEIEIDRNEFETFHDYCPGIMLTGLRSGIKNDGRWMSDTEIYVTDNLKITDMSLGQTIWEERTQQKDEETNRREEEENMRLRQEEEQQADNNSASHGVIAHIDVSGGGKIIVNSDFSDNRSVSQHDPESTAIKSSGSDIILEYPVEDHIVSEPYNGSSHKGIDFAVPKGTPVYASADGTVTSSSTGRWSNGYGNMIMIDHGNELTTLYAHLNECIAEEGDEVKTGDLIGYSGHTGDTTGNILHFEVRLDGQYTDPLQFLNSGTSSPAGTQGTPDQSLPEDLRELFADPIYGEVEDSDGMVINMYHNNPEFIYPVENGSSLMSVNEPYRYVINYSDYGKEVHSIRKTVKFSVPEGTPVYSSADGIVEISEETTAGKGDMIKIGYSYELSITYSNLSKRLVNVGDRIKKGDLIGYSGKNYTSSEADFGEYLEMMIKVGGESNSEIYTELLLSDNGDKMIPYIVYGGMFYQISEEITGTSAAEKYRDGSLKPLGGILGNKFLLDVSDEHYSNFIPGNSSNTYKYMDGEQTDDQAGTSIPPSEDDDLAIVVVYDLNGEHVTVFRPIYNDQNSGKPIY